jgi:hypothetical protein
MSLQSATERPQGTFPLWLRITLPCMFLALTLIRILDNGIAKLGWIGDLCIAFGFLIFVPRPQREPRGTYFKRPRMLVEIVLFGIALVFSILFDFRHFFAN